MTPLTLNRIFDWYLLAAVACMACLATWRLVALYRRGVRVVVVDRKRTAAEMFLDLLLLVSMLLWGWLIIAFAWPLAVRLVPDRLDLVLINAVVLKLIGAVLVTAGVVLYGLALPAMGDSWRLGIDRKSPGRLMTAGVFAWTRNPIYLAFDLLAAGTFLVQGRLVFLLLAIVIVLAMHEQVRREERFLTEQFGDEYRDYCARTGRYVTWRMSPHERT